MSLHEDSVTLRQMLDYAILWHIVASDFPPLAHQIKALLPDKPS